jgi:hypothetical protein
VKTKLAYVFTTSVADIRRSQRRNEKAKLRQHEQRTSNGKWKDENGKLKVL